jgi:hypothetical protein
VPVNDRNFGDVKPLGVDVSEGFEVKIKGSALHITFQEKLERVARVHAITGRNIF